MAGRGKITTSKREISERKILLKELPYYNYTGSLIKLHGQFNNSLMDKHQPTKYELIKNLPILYDINVFDLNTILDSNIRPYHKLTQQSNKK